MSLTFQDLRICADTLYDAIHNKVNTWDSEILDEVLTKIENMLDGICLMEILPDDKMAFNSQLKAIQIHLES